MTFEYLIKKYKKYLFLLDRGKTWSNEHDEDLKDKFRGLPLYKLKNEVIQLEQKVYEFKAK